MSASNPFGGTSGAPPTSPPASPYQANLPNGNSLESTVRQLPSYLHIGVTGVSIISSFVIALLPHRPTVEFNGNTADYLSLFAYILTPLLVVLMLALARASDIKRRSNPYFDVMVSIRNLRVLAILTAFSFVLGTWHIYQFARLYFVK